jgi:hypothetical protein
MVKLCCKSEIGNWTGNLLNIWLIFLNSHLFIKNDLNALLTLFTEKGGEEEEWDEWQREGNVGSRFFIRPPPTKLLHIPPFFNAFLWHYKSKKNWNNSTARANFFPFFPWEEEKMIYISYIHFYLNWNETKFHELSSLDAKLSVP